VRNEECSIRTCVWSYELLVRVEKWENDGAGAYTTEEVIIASGTC